MSEGDEAAELARRAVGDIPPQFCTVVDTDITGDLARIWLLTNDAAHWQTYQVNYRREGGSWVEVSSGGGFQTGTPDRVRERVRDLTDAAGHGSG
jgi:alkanesulfonate monooxygenase SsuD/methylene tetrahydromethanopterin reductase-like flavin-dependent oxidoreductase (luciferase family)